MDYVRQRGQCSARCVRACANVDVFIYLQGSYRHTMSYGVTQQLPGGSCVATATPRHTCKNILCERLMVLTLNPTEFRTLVICNFLTHIKSCHHCIIKIITCSQQYVSKQHCVLDSWVRRRAGAILGIIKKTLSARKSLTLHFFISPEPPLDRKWE